MNHRFNVGLFSLLIIGQFVVSCKKMEQEPETLKNKLSAYAIYNSDPSTLTPNSDYKLYELSSQLFTDYAEKQRLIKLPAGTTMKAVNNGLLDFPEGTIIVKTFYYYKDKRNPARGRNLIETRILELINGEWIAGTYAWNHLQTDAFLIPTGLNTTVNWIDESGNPKLISYQIPSDLACKTCHNSNNTIVPIGPKARNLNRDVIRNGVIVNQLTYLNDEGVLNAVAPNSYSTLPNYNDVSKTIQERARAYLDMNCAHCHSEKGFAKSQRYRMNFETSLDESKIPEGKAAIRNKMEKTEMPKIGTTVIDKEGLELIKKFIETL